MKFPYFILLLSMFSSSCGAQNAYGYLKTTPLLTKKQDSTNVDLTANPGIILLASENTCSKCYENLETFLSKDSLNLIAVIRIPNCISCRREFIKKYTIFKYCDSIYYDIHANTGSFLDDKCQDGLFSKLKVCRTPALIFNYKEYQIIFTYDQLFSGLQVSASFKKEYKKFVRTFYK